MSGTTSKRPGAWSSRQAAGCSSRAEPGTVYQGRRQAARSRPSLRCGDFGVVPLGPGALGAAQHAGRSRRAEDHRRPEKGAGSDRARGSCRSSSRCARSEDRAKFREPITGDQSKRRKRQTWRTSSRSSASAWTRSSSRPRARSPLPGEDRSGPSGRDRGPHAPSPSGSSCPKTRPNEPGRSPRRGTNEIRRRPASRSSWIPRTRRAGSIRKLVETPGIPGGQAEGPQGGPRAPR